MWLEPTEDSDLILLVMDLLGISASQTSWLNWKRLTLRCRRKRQRKSRFCFPPDKTTPCFLHTLDTNKQNTNKKETSTCNLWGRGERVRKVPRTGSLGSVPCSRASQRVKLQQLQLMVAFWFRALGESSQNQVQSFKIKFNTLDRSCLGLYLVYFWCLAQKSFQQIEPKLHQNSQTERLTAPSFSRVRRIMIRRISNRKKLWMCFSTIQLFHWWSKSQNLAGSEQQIQESHRCCNHDSLEPENSVWTHH